MWTITDGSGSVMADADMEPGNLSMPVLVRTQRL